MNPDRKEKALARLRKKTELRQQENVRNLQSATKIYRGLQPVIPIDHNESPQQLAQIATLAAQMQPIVRQSVRNADNNASLASEARQLLQKGLDEKLDYEQALLKLKEARAAAQQGHASDVMIKAGLYIIKLALKNQDLATALLQCDGLKELVELPLFAMKVDPVIGRQLGTVLEPRHEGEIYLLIALTMLYKGNFRAAILYHNKIIEKFLLIETEWQKEWQALQEIIKIIWPYLKKIPKKEHKNNLKSIAAILTLLEQEGVDYARQQNFDQCYETYQKLMLIIDMFTLADRFKADDAQNEYREYYLSFQHLLAEININWGEELLKQLQYITNADSNINYTIIDKLSTTSQQLFTSALAYAQKTANAALTYLTACYLIECRILQYMLFSNTQVNDLKEQCIKYATIRDQAKAQLKKRVLREPSQTTQTTEVAIFQLAVESTQTEAALTEQAYLNWQKQYDTIVVTIPEAELSQVVERLKALLSKHEAEPHKKACILFGLAEAYYFHTRNVRTKIMQLQHDLDELVELAVEVREEGWHKLEYEFATIQESAQIQIYDLKIAANYLCDATQYCVAIPEEKLIAAPKLEYANYKKLVVCINEATKAINHALTAITQATQDFTQQMQTKRLHLIGINKYGAGPKRTRTTDIVNGYLKQTTELNKISEIMDVLINDSEDLAEAIKLRNTMESIMLTSRANRAGEIAAYKKTHEYYSEVAAKYKATQQPHYMALAEWQLSWVTAMQTNEAVDPQDKTELLKISLMHSKNALVLYKKFNTDQQYDKYIALIEHDIQQKVELQKTLANIQSTAASKRALRLRN